mmetsp:Transcript_39652/g.81503  ORF Transcript_39652/g.81503 Transcript_39652/m.81503 type:complete len:334 (-) Transcript_39652:718-1719(-)
MRPEAPFLSWCTAQGIASPLQLQGIGTSYRYLASPNDQPEGRILEVPLDACIVDSTKEALAERLAHERSIGSKSKYGPYLDVLPDLESFSNFPRFWTPKRRDFVFDYDGGEVERRVATDERKELDPWAYACVSSRANFLNDYRYSLTPLLDFLNHLSTVGTSASINDEKLSLSINRELKAGKEVYISYGALSNIDTLCDYGFVSSDNPCNIEMMEIRLLGSPSVALAVYPDGSIDKSAVAMLRQNLATPEELEMAQSRDRNILTKFSSQLSDRNELDVFSLVCSSLDDGAQTASSGAAEAGSDQLVATYLSARAATLRRGIAKILEQFPDLEY